MLSLLFPAVLFGLVYFPTLKYLSVGLVTPYAKVDVKKRLRPIPRDWHKASEVELESMCARAERAARTSRRLIE